MMLGVNARRRPDLSTCVQETYFNPVGSTSFTTTLVASAGPSFVTMTVMWIVSPWFGFRSSTEVDTFRSASDAEIARSADAVLFADVGSVCAPATLTGFAIVASVVVGSTVASNDATWVVGVVEDVALASVGMFHVHVLPATVAVVPAGGAVGGEATMSPAGSASVTTTVVASVVVLGLVTVTVYVTVSPGAAVVGSTVIATPRSTGFAVGVNESVFDVVVPGEVGSRVDVVTVAVLLIAVASEADALMVATNETVWGVPRTTSGTVHVTT